MHYMRDWLCNSDTVRKQIHWMENKRFTHKWIAFIAENTKLVYLIFLCWMPYYKKWD